MAYESCLREIRRLAGNLSDATIEQLLSDVAIRARNKARLDPTLGPAGAFKAAASELAAEAKAAAAIARRNTIENLKKRLGRRDFYARAPQVGKTPGAIIGLEAKLVGVNTPFKGSRLSVDAQGKGLSAEYVGGLTKDLDQAGLFEAMRGGQYDREWARELFELSKGKGGQPGITKNDTARRIAETVHKYQTLAVDGLNRAGAWIGHYDGFISRTSHDPDRIRRAGFPEWRRQILETLDTGRTFADLENEAEAERFLENVYNGLITGVHLTQDGLQGFKDPAFSGPGNLAKRLSQSKVLHFKSADAWLDYHAAFGNRSLAESVLGALDQAAKNTALMREFGSSPRAELEADLRWLQETRRGDTKLVDAIRHRTPLLTAFMNQLDGTARQPVHRLGASISAGWRTWISLSKLGGVVLSSVSDVVTKARELRYQGLNLLDVYGDAVTSVVRGRGFAGSVQRQVADLLRAGMEGMRGHIASRFDGADTVPGTLAKAANTFFRWTGLTYWTDAQRAGAEVLMARHLGSQKDLPFGSLGKESQRMLTAFGIAPEHWELLRGALTPFADGRHYVTPDAALRIDARAIADHLKAAGLVPKAEARGVAPARIDAFRHDLALKLHAYFSDRGEYAVLAPGARERAMLVRNTQPGTMEGEALRLVTQFKAFPLAVVTKALGRDVYGGDVGLSRIAGITHMIVGSTLAGYAAMTAKELFKGRSPRDPREWKTWGAAFTQGGGAGIYGDYIVGEYSRFGNSFLASVGGPTAATAEDVVDLWNRVKADTHDLKEPRDAAAAALKLGLSLAPGVNLFYTRMVLDYLLIYQIQEALNPGYLRRFERNVQKQNHQNFLIRPSAAIPYGGGNRLFEGVRGP